MKPVQREVATQPCAHPDIEYLGDNREVRFLRCGACAQVFVIQNGRSWAFPALPSRGAANDPDY